MKDMRQEVMRCNVTHYCFAVSSKGTPGSFSKGLLWKGCKKESRSRAVHQRKEGGGIYLPCFHLLSSRSIFTHAELAPLIYPTPDDCPESQIPCPMVRNFIEVQKQRASRSWRRTIQERDKTKLLSNVRRYKMCVPYSYFLSPFSNSSDANLPAQPQQGLDSCFDGSSSSDGWRRVQYGWRCSEAPY